MANVATSDSKIRENIQSRYQHSHPSIIVNPNASTHTPPLDRRTLIMATAVLAAAIAMVKAASAFGLWLPVRWLAGGIGILAFAEMVTAGLPLGTAAFGLTVPPLFQSPHRSASVGEF